MLSPIYKPRPSRPLLNWLLRLGAWGLVLGCGLALLSNDAADATTRSRWTTGIWCGFVLYVLALAWDLVLRMRSVQRDVPDAGGVR